MSVSQVITPAVEGRGGVTPSLLAQREVIEYPDSDGEPMAENDAQYRCIVGIRFGLEQYYRAQPLVYVGADLLIYYQEGDPGKSVASDVFVALGVPKGLRRNYLIWAEGKPPDVVFEFASPGSWRADVGWKRGLYQGLGVREYFLFDPGGEYFRPALQGYRLEDQVYKPIAALEARQGILGLHSEVLALELWVKPDGGEGMPYLLRLYDPATGAWLPTPEEEAEARRIAQARAVEEATARRAAEARVAELQAELERLRETGSGS